MMGRKRKAPTSTGRQPEFDTSRFSQKSETEDMVLIVEEKKLYVSKAVLQLASPVFNAMFESDFKEKDMEEIELKEKKYDDMIEFLKCLYPGSRQPITMDNVFIVLPLADEYQVDAIKNECEQCFLRALEKKRNIRRLSSVKFVCHIQQQSSLYNLADAEKECIEILCKQSQKEIESAEKVFPLSVKSKNVLVTKINKRLEETIKRLENDLEMKDEIIDMKDEDNVELKTQLEKRSKELETLTKKLSDADCENRTQGFIRIDFLVSHLPYTGQLSEPKKFRGLDWRCKVSKDIQLQLQAEEYLGLWACFDPGYPHLECNAIVSFKVLNKKANGSDYICHMTESTFNSGNCSWGFADRLKWEEFVNPENGYVVNDWATVEMFVVTFKPRFVQDRKPIY